MKTSLNLKRIFHPSGGLVYHFTAMRYGRSAWKPFRDQVAVWLNSWRTPPSQLVIVGPSGGYCLNKEFLKRFESIVLVETDPIAPWMFRMRHSLRKGCLTDRCNYFLPKDSETSQGGLDLFFDRYKNSAILFSNVIGQLSYEEPYVKDPDFFLDLLEELKGFLDQHPCWLSFHDSLSSKTRFQLASDSVSLEPGESPESLLQQIRFDATPTGTEVEIMDHDTSQMFENFVRHYGVWHLTPLQHHLIECVIR